MSRLASAALLSAVWAISFCGATSDSPKREHRFVAVRNGLHLRVAPNPTAKSLVVIPYNERIALLGESSAAATIAGYTGPWIKVIWQSKQGWVFSPFVLRYRIQVSLEQAGECCLRVHRLRHSQCIASKCPQACQENPQTFECGICRESCGGKEGCQGDATEYGWTPTPEEWQRQADLAPLIPYGVTKDSFVPRALPKECAGIKG